VAALADLSDVTAALVAAAAAALYPNGTPPSVTGSPIAIYAGWPDPKTLDADLPAGKVHVSVSPAPGHERNTTRYQDDWAEGDIQPATFTLAIEGDGIRVGGAAPATFYPQNLSAVVGGVAYAVQSQSNSTPSSLAAALRALISGASVSGSLVTPPAGAKLGALAVGGQGTAQRTIRQQERLFWIIIWAPTPEARRAVGEPIDLALADTAFLTLADGSAARLVYQGTAENDFDQKQGVYRRDLHYRVDYATTRTDIFAQVVSTEVDTKPSFDGVNPLQTFITIG
jgi:hypothetical protein